MATGQWVRERAYALGQAWAEETFGDLAGNATVLLYLHIWHNGRDVGYLQGDEPQRPFDLAITGGNLRRRRVSTVAPLIVYRKEKKRRRSSASVPASSSFLEQRSSRLFLLGVIRRILGLKGVAVRFYFLFSC